jgi:hypothetical protein
MTRGSTSIHGDTYTVTVLQDMCCSIVETKYSPATVPPRTLHIPRTLHSMYKIGLKIYGCVCTYCILDIGLHLQHTVDGFHVKYA